jgi:hypothetical protein
VVVVGADHDVLVGEVGAGDHGDHVGPAGQRLGVGRVASRSGVEPVRDRLELLDQELARQRGAGRVVVASGGVVSRETADVVLRAAGEQRA